MTAHRQRHGRISPMSVRYQHNANTRALAREARSRFAYVFYGLLLLGILLACIFGHRWVSVARAEMMPPLTVEQFIPFVGK